NNNEHNESLLNKSSFSSSAPSINENLLLVDHDPDSGDNNNTDDENPNSMDIDSDAEETLLFESNENNDYSSAIKKRAKEFMKLYSQSLYNLTMYYHNHLVVPLKSIKNSEVKYILAGTSSSALMTMNKEHWSRFLSKLEETIETTNHMDV
ncbi:4845_t:CDS:2, partial [Entrophospora sp. SA101]